MGFFDFLKGKGTVDKQENAADAEETVISECFTVVGTRHYENNIQCLRKRNPDWRKDGKTLAAEGKVMEKVPQYIYTASPVKLVEEPDNPHDKNAVMVKIAGLKVGYIGREETKHIKEILKAHEIKTISAIFKGGKYKIVSQNGNAVEVDNLCTVKIQIDYIQRGVWRLNEPTILTPDAMRDCEVSFFAIDLETTGMSRTDDRIIELSAVAFERSQPVRTFATLVNPHRPIRKQASQVNHITNADVKNAPDEREAIQSFCDFMGAPALQGNVIVVAHNNSFDLGFLSEAFKRCNIGAKIRTYDTLALSRKLLPGLENYKLGTVAEELGIQQSCAHRAEDDALVCGEIFVHLLNKVKQQHMDRLDEMSELERGICQWIKDTLKSAGCETKYLSFNVSTYLSVNYYWQIMRLKPRARKPYALIEKQYPIPDTMQTAPATKSEGEGYVRVFFERPEDLGSVKDAIVRQYEKVFQKADECLNTEPFRMKELADIIDRQVCL